MRHRPPTPFAYYGSKARLAPQIATLLPSHRVYAEPFCGSAAVLFRKRPSPHEVINDRFGEVVNFFRVLRDRAPDLARAVRLTPYAREEFEHCRRAFHRPDLDEVERARCFFALSCQSVNATAVFRRSGWSAGQQQHTSRARATRRRADALEQFADRLRDVTVEHADAMEVIDACDLPDAALYVDPPYLATTRASVASRAAGDYAHELMSDEDHEALAHRLLSFRGAVIVSGYDSPLYSRLHRRWDRVLIPTLRTSSNRSGVAADRAVEVLWSNRTISHQPRLWNA